MFPWRGIVYVWNRCSKPQAGSFAIIRDLLCLCYWWSAEIWLLNTLSIYIVPTDWQLWTNSMRQYSLINPIFMTFFTSALQGSSSRLPSGLMLSKEIRWNFIHFSRITSFPEYSEFDPGPAFASWRNSVLTFWCQVVTIRTIRFNIEQFYVLPTQCIYVFCVDLRTNSDYFPIQH